MEGPPFEACPPRLPINSGPKLSKRSTTNAGLACKTTASRRLGLEMVPDASAVEDAAEAVVEAVAAFRSSASNLRT